MTTKTSVLTPLATLIYPNIFTPRSFTNQSDGVVTHTYSVVLGFKEDAYLQPVKDAISECFKDEKFKDIKPEHKVLVDGNYSPLKTPYSVEKADSILNNYAYRIQCTQRCRSFDPVTNTADPATWIPIVVSRDGKETLIDRSLVYSGTLAYAHLAFKACKHEMNLFIKAYLNALYIPRELRGEPLKTNVDLSDAFKNVELPTQLLSEPIVDNFEDLL